MIKGKPFVKWAGGKRQEMEVMDVSICRKIRLH